MCASLGCVQSMEGGETDRERDRERDMAEVTKGVKIRNDLFRY